MNDMIAFCGLDCELCEARLATVNDDWTLREKVAELWSEMNGIVIHPEEINCTGCRSEGVKTVFCEKLCQIRSCAMEKQLDSCGACEELKECKKLSMITANNSDALNRLGDYRKLL